MRTYIVSLTILMLVCLTSSVTATDLCDGSINIVTGETWPTDNGNGTVTDSVTGLTWKQCLEGQSGADCTATASTPDWPNALTLDDGIWRLPNIKELQSIVEYANYGPAINITCFPTPVGTSDIYVWSASPLAAAAPPPTSAWGINFKDGSFFDTAQDTSLNVRLVCDGNSATCQP